MKKIRSIVTLSLAFYLSGCAQTQWVHPSKSEAQFRMDLAQCQMQATTNVPQQTAAPVVPVYVPPTQYDTSCSRMGVYTNCTTTAQSNLGAQLAQQNAQNAAQAGANIGTGIARGQYAENCMIALGYTKQIVDKGAQEKVSNQVGSFNADMKLLSESFKSDVCSDKGLQSIFNHSACNPNEISVSQLSDNSFLREEDKEAFNRLNSISREYSNKEIEIIEKYVPLPLRNSLTLLSRKAFSQGQTERALPLYKGEITWGEYNKRRTEAQIRFLEERKAILSRGR